MVRDEKKEGDFDKRSIIESGRNLLNTIYEDGEKRPELEGGRAYLLKEERPEKSFSLALERMRKDGMGYLLTQIKAEKIRKKYNLPEEMISYHRLGDPSKEENFDPSVLVLIAHSITNFLKEKGGTAMIEGVEALLENNTFDKFITFLDNLVKVTKVQEGILIINLDPEALPEEKLGQIEERLELLP
ncbi:MAG: DUF835 domain-containing protein [Candidatus Thermoplasmatota archaeon]